MIMTMLLLAAVQAAPTPTPPAPPAPPKIVNEVVIRTFKDGLTVRTETRSGERREVIVTNDGKPGEGEQRIRIGGGEPGKPGEKREITIVRENATGGAQVAMVDKCAGDARFESRAESDKEGKKTEARILVCSRGNGQVEALERASKRLAENKDIPDDVRNRVLTQMSAEIARLKAAR